MMLRCSAAFNRQLPQKLRPLPAPQQANYELREGEIRYRPREAVTVCLIWPRRPRMRRKPE